MSPWFHRHAGFLGWRILGGPLARLGALGCVLASCGLGGTEVEVYLNNGDVIRGNLIENDLDHIKLRRDIPTRNASIAVENTYYRGSFIQWREVEHSDPEYDRRARVLPDTAPAHLDLAHWCRDQDLPGQARIQALRAVQLSPHDPDITSLLIDLGYTYADGSWQELNHYLLKNGQVRYAGRIMSQGDAEVLRQKAHDDQRISDLIQAITVNNQLLERLHQALAATEQDLQSLPAQITATKESIQQQKEAQGRFARLMQAGAPGLGDEVDGGSDAPADEARSRVDLANARAQAQDAYRLLPLLQKHLAELHRQWQLLQLSKEHGQEQISQAKDSLAKQLATLDALRSESAALKTPPSAQP